MSNLYAVCSGVVCSLTKRVVGREGVHNYGDTWIVVNASSPEGALEQAKAYDEGRHPAQTEMGLFAATFSGMEPEQAIKWAGWELAR